MAQKRKKHGRDLRAKVAVEALKGMRRVNGLVIEYMFEQQLEFATFNDDR